MVDRRAAGFGPQFYALLSVFLVAGCGASSQRSLIYQDPGSANIGSVHIAGEDTNSLVINMNVPDANFERVILDGQEFTKLTIDGFENSKTPGLPEIPSTVFYVAIPEGRELRFEVDGTEFTHVEQLQNDLAYTSRVPVHSDKLIFADRNVPAYELVHGAKPVELVDVSYGGAVKLATFQVFPAMFDAAKREVSLRKSFAIHISFLPVSLTAKTSAPVGGGFNVGAFVAINGNHFASTPGDSRVDLIIASAVHTDVLKRYIDFKRNKGREVREYYVTGKTSAEIKAIIATEYQSPTPPTHTLLVGNIAQIPSWRGSADNSWTDYNYTTLDAGEVPDVSLGRIPALNAQELGSFIDKAIAREAESRNNDDVLLTAGRDVSLGCPASVTKVGTKIKAGSASINIISKYRSNGASTDDVLNAYNGSPNIVVYDGHGDRQGMQEIPLLISNLSRLTNNRHPIIFDIACLNANWSGGAAARNFAESILLREDTGAAGILASGGSGYGHDFFQTMGSLMAQARQELAVGDSPLNEVGLVILGAKIQHGREDRSFWNYYGDPATTVWSGGAP